MNGYPSIAAIPEQDVGNDNAATASNRAPEDAPLTPEEIAGRNVAYQHYLEVNGLTPIRRVLSNDAELPNGAPALSAANAQ